MDIEIKDCSGMKVIAPSGDIDMHTSPELRRAIMKFVNEKVPVLLVDFKAVSYIDSSGIATFVEGLKGMMPYGGKLKFLDIPEGIMEIFSFSKLNKVFEIYKNMDDATKG